ncbi:MAG: aminodeoxychorismate synthase component I [Alphaproteobacteria bacterium]|nr:MAG: aminodeoxychorismate synthase component I [Alphaproteobacteria bacterium]
MATPFVLLETIGNARAGFPNRFYAAPREVIVCTCQDEVSDAIAAMDSALEAGCHLAGWIAYEVGYALEPRLAPLAPRDGTAPLIWMGVFDGFEVVDGSLRNRLVGAPRHEANAFMRVDSLEPGITKAVYADALARIHDYLVAGDVYQINYTFPLRFRLEGTPGALYRRLRDAQPVGFGAWIDTGEITVLSLSPELFMEKAGTSMTTRPMKGTMPRGRTPAEDDEAARSLATDPKSRAENLMIVDLLRNDLSRIAKAGSVKVPELFAVERYRTLLQMTSTITAQVDRDLSMAALLRSLFPCGSVTGAPKIRAMEIIRELESAPRGPYTGAIGCISPDRDFTFSVPIRTLTLQPEDPTGRVLRGTLGIGSGIVADSETAAEYEECLLKGRFLTAPQPAFDLIETLGWSKGEGYRFLDRHLARLGASARFFGFTFDENAVRAQLDHIAQSLTSESLYRVRLVLAESGAVTVSAAPMTDRPPETPQVTLARSPVDSADPLLYHKTTARQFYNRELAAARASTGCIDVLFQNERGALTEGSFTNLFIEKSGQLLTPPVDAGLLPGVLRAELIATGRAVEAALTPADLEQADGIYVGNALRGLIEVSLAPSSR